MGDIVVDHTSKLWSKLEGKTGKLPADLVKGHLALYSSYVAEANRLWGELENLIKAQNLTKASSALPAEVREKKRQFLHRINSIRNHELYFRSLGRGSAADKAPGGALGAFLLREFGSFDAYRADLFATALGADQGWAWTVLDHFSGRFFNVAEDSDAHCPLWHATPVLALDMHPHARGEAFRSPEEYLEALWEILDWKEIESRLPKGA
jgi:superoxide dismutase